MALYPRLQESAIDYHGHQLLYFPGAAARALLSLLPSFDIAKMYAKSVSLRAYNLSI
jgi:hypothetical protein